MKLISNYIDENSILFPLDVSSKKEAIDSLVELIDQEEAKEELKNNIWEREMKMTTGIGWGVAIPHCYYEKCDDLIIKIGICPQGIEYDSIDNKKVKLIFLDIAPQNKTKLHQEYLQKLSILLTKKENRDLLLNCVDKKDFIESLKIIESF